MSLIKLTNVSSPRGAPMGRYEDGRDAGPTKERVQLQSVPLTDGYDSGGAYWGSPGNLFIAQCGEDENFRRIFLRANSRDQAKSEVSKLWPGCKFYR